MIPEESESSRKSRKFAESIRKEHRESIKNNIRYKLIEEQSKLTPGKKLREKQQEILNKEIFIGVFGAEKIQDLDVNWDVFSNSELEFDHPSIRNSLKKIKDFLMQEQSFELLGKVAALEGESKNVHGERIKELARKHFQEVFSDDFSDIAFDLKQGGDQLGNKAKVKKTNQQIITYHIKTHSDGLKSSCSSGAKQLDPKELLVYKILENFDIGCETHFFGRDLKNFYIATKDAGADNDFLSYESLKKQAGVLSKVWKNLSNQKNECEDLLKPTEDFINGIVSLDLLSRILRLTDLQTNSGNFGFVDQQGTYKVKAIDFRIRDDNTFRVTEDHFGGLVEGNGVFTYTDPAMSYVFKKWPHEKRMVATKNVFNKSLLKAQDVIEKSIKQVMEAIENISEKNQVNISEQKKLLEENLSEYAKDLEHNFNFFGEKLAQY